MKNLIKINDSNCTNIKLNNSLNNVCGTYKDKPSVIIAHNFQFII